MATDLPKEALRSLFVTLSGLPASRVLWSGEVKGFAGPTGAGQTGHLMLDLVASKRLGVDEEEREYGVEVSPGVFVTRVTYSGYRIRTISITAENYEHHEEGWDTLERIRVQLSSDDTQAILNAAELAMFEDLDVKNLGGSAGNRATTFAILDVRMAQRISLVVDKDPDVTGDTYIDAVEVTGEPDLDAAGTWQIGPPSP